MFTKSFCLTPRPWVLRTMMAAACLLPSLLLAHPGHYHPGEEDEFDFFRATFVHSHGAYDGLLIALVLGMTLLICFSRSGPVRVGALLAAVGSLALVPVL